MKGLAFWNLCEGPAVRVRVGEASYAFNTIPPQYLMGFREVPYILISGMRLAKRVYCAFFDNVISYSIDYMYVTIDHVCFNRVLIPFSCTLPFGPRGYLDAKPKVFGFWIWTLFGQAT